MSLTPGQTLSFYEILSPLGAGGMGEVWLARDTRLQREVALKVLPPQFAADDERLQRFDREARSVAALNHPNVAGIHGVDQVDDMYFLALELVPGEDLAQRLSRGPLPLPELLDVARQIAEGLEAAHEAGVVHRDLKPANIRITPEGVVKLLDFGLAKSSRQPAGGSGTGTAVPDSFLSTEDGLVLGTPTYMSPEQARGKPVDRRTDIWAFGCLLFECLTARRAFEGGTVTDVLAAIVEREPDWSALPTNTPPWMRRLMSRCLDKDPRSRLRDIGEARVLLADPHAAAVPGTTDEASARGRLPWALAGLAILVAAALLAREWATASPTTTAGTATRFVLEESVLFPGHWGGNVMALSPCGRFIATVGVPGDARLHLRALDAFESVPLEGTDDARAPFFSPDGEQLGYWSRGALRRRPTAGGPGTEIARMAAINSADWGSGDTIVVAERVGSLLRVDVATGAVTPLTRSGDAVSHDHPALIDDGRAVLFDSNSQLFAARMDDGSVTSLGLEGRHPRWSPSGHVVATRADGSLWVTPFDQESLTATGPSTSVLDESVLAFDVSAEGTLAYVPGSAYAESQLVWVDRQGEAEPLRFDPGRFFAPRLSPTGDAIAVVESRENTAIWLLDNQRGSRLRLTSSETWSSWPVWTHAGSRVAYLSDGTIHWKPADGSGEPRGLLESAPRLDVPMSWSEAMGALAFYDYGQASDLHVWHADGAVEEFLATPFDERAPMLSPDGSWLAYVSDQSGSDEVYVRPHARGEKAGPRVALSVAGGVEPRWSTDGRELFYRRGSQLFAVGFEAGSPPRVTEPELLFDRPYALSPVGRGNPDYDVAADGRFLMLRPDEQQALPRVHVVRGWSPD